MNRALEVQKKNTKLSMRIATSSESRTETLEPPVYVSKTHKKIAIAESMQQKEINTVVGVFASLGCLMNMAKIAIDYAQNEVEEEDDDMDSQFDENENPSTRDEDFAIEDWK